MTYPILLVDDDSLVLHATKCLLNEHGYQVETVASGEQAVEQVRIKPNYYAIAIVDYQMQSKNGGVTAQELLALNPNMYVLVYSGDYSREAMRATWQAGAVGFIEKQCSAEILLETVRRWSQKYEETFAMMDVARSFDDGELKETLNMVGRSQALKEAAKKVKRYREDRNNVLILGETGTGKELIARALHGEAAGTFLAVNCAAFKGNADLFESELFGHERGSFTGADREKKGILEMAEGGTVFMDEVHHLSLTAQAKLLRVFQEKKIRRVGGAKEYSVDFRLITAAKPNLEALCGQSEFLWDLYHRLNVLSITLPPLRERPEDIEPLVSFFCAKYEAAKGRKKSLRIRTLRYLENYAWPGNVRELENTIYGLLTDSTGKEVGPELLDGRFFAAAGNSGNSTYEELKARHEKEEREQIRRVLDSSGSKFQAAKRLKVSPTTLHSIMKRVGLYQAE